MLLIEFGLQRIDVLLDGINLCGVLRLQFRPRGGKPVELVFVLLFPYEVAVLRRFFYSMHKTITLPLKFHNLAFDFHIAFSHKPIPIGPSLGYSVPKMRAIRGKNPFAFKVFLNVRDLIRDTIVFSRCLSVPRIKIRSRLFQPIGGGRIFDLVCNLVFLDPQFVNVADNLFIAVLTQRNLLFQAGKDRQKGYACERN